MNRMENIILREATVGDVSMIEDYIIEKILTQ